MPDRLPHYQLTTDVRGDTDDVVWRFELQSEEDDSRFLAEDSEPQSRRDRVELLAVVRGLEALAQPSRVTLYTTSQYVRRGMAYGLDEWRRNGWQWEHFGQMVQVKNHDLWQRLDHALAIHQVDCRQWRIDTAHQGAGMSRRGRPVLHDSATGSTDSQAEAGSRSWSRWRDLVQGARRRVAAAIGLPSAQPG